MAVIDLTPAAAHRRDRCPPAPRPAGVSINRAGTLALVANRAEGTVSVFRIANGQVTPSGKVDIGTVASEVVHVAFTPDGRMRW